MADRSPRDGIIIVQIDDDERLANLHLLLELSRMSDNIVVVPPPSLNLPESEDLKSTLSQLDLDLSVLIPRRRRKSKWRKPSERGRR